jgi:hypothetical protein
MGKISVSRTGKISGFATPTFRALGTAQRTLGVVQSRNICLGHVLVAVRIGQRRDAVATGEDRHGRCAAGQGKYIRLYRYSGKLALAAMNLRRVREVGRSFAAGAPPLTHVCTKSACGKKTRRGPPAALPGAGVWRRAWGDGARCPSTACHATSKAKYSLGRFSKLLTSKTCYYGGNWHQSPVTSHHADRTNFVSAPQRLLLNPPCSARLL